MDAGTILTNIAIIFVAIAVLDDLRKGGRLNGQRKSWLMIAVIFSAVSLFVHIMQSL